MEASPGARSPSGIAVWVIGLVVMAVCLWAPTEKLVAAFAMDDGLYYPRIAQHIVSGRGLTFDGQTLTNGFHPLWEALLVPLAVLAQGDPTTMLRLTFLLQGALVLLGIVALRGLASELSWTESATVTATAVLVFARVDLWLCLLEAGPTMAVLLLTLWAMTSKDLLRAVDTGKAAGFGFLMALVFLVRLDQVFIVIALYAAAVLLRWRARQGMRGLRALVISAVVTAVCVLPYLAANYAWFGHIVPVSGRKKHVRAESVADFLQAAFYPLIVVARKLALPVPILVLLVVATVGGVAWAAMQHRREGVTRPEFLRHGVLPAFTIGVLVRFTYLRWFVSEESAIVPWYWVPETVLAVLCVGSSMAVVSARWAKGRDRLVAMALLTVSLLGGTAYQAVDSRRTMPNSQAVIDVGRWAAAHFDGSERCAVYDPGIFSYYSRCDTVALNGLIGDEWTMERSLVKDYEAILDRHGVTHVAEFVHPDEIESIPPGGLVHLGSYTLHRGVHRGSRLAILDRRVVKTLFRQDGHKPPETP